MELTALRAQKVSAVIGAYLDGHQLYADAVRAAVDLLQAVALQARGISCDDLTAQSWATLADTPWPTFGTPRPQPDSD